MFSGASQCPWAFRSSQGFAAHVSLWRGPQSRAKYHGLREGEIDLDETEIDEAPEPSQVFLQQEQSQVIQQAISSLPLQQREALILSQYEELPLEEIAAILGIDIGAVKSRLHRARARLKRILTPYFEGSNAR